MAHARLPGSCLATFWLGACAVSLAAGCGGAASVPDAATPAPPPPAPVIPAPDLTEVAEPENLVVVARWSNPDTSTNAVQGWTGMPLDLRRFLQDEMPSWLADAAALDAPIDFALALGPGSADAKPTFEGAIAMGLRADVEQVRQAALAQGEAVEQVDTGVYRLRAFDLECALAASAGPVPTRIVCGDTTQDLERFAPYMTRTLSRRELGQGDLVVELRLVPFEQRYGQKLQQVVRMGASVLPAQLQIGQPRFDRALTDAVYGLADETVSLAGDLDKLVLSVDARSDVARGSLAIQFRGTDSWTVQTALDAGRRAAAAPPIYWRLPADATSASFSRGASSQRFTAIRQTLAALADGWLTHENVKASDREGLLALFSDEYASDAVSVSASGPYDQAVLAGLAAGEGDIAQMRRDFARSGWQLVGIDEPADKWLALNKRFVTAYNSPAVQKQLERALKELDVKLAVPQLKIVKAPKELPQGTVEMTLVIADAKAKAKTAKNSATFYAFLMPDTGRTWIAFGIDRPTLVKRLQAVRSDAPESGTLASRKGLDALKHGAYTSAGYVTIGGLVHALEGAFQEVFPRYGLDKVSPSRLLSGIPHAGATPILIANEVRSADGATAWVSGIEMPRDAIEDVVAAVMQVAVGAALPQGKTTRAPH